MFLVAVQTAVACMKQFVCPHAVGARAMGYACVCGGVSEYCLFRVLVFAGFVCVGCFVSGSVLVFELIDTDAC